MSEIDKYNKEIQSWLGSPPKTLKRYKLFYESIVSIHLGGEGIQTLISNAKTPEDAKLTFAMYKINYPKEEFVYLTDKEVRLITPNPKNKCEICNDIINNKLIHTNETGYYLLKNEMDTSEITHIEQIIKHKL